MKKDTVSWCLWYLAERKGFEPSIRYSRIHAFQACDLNHSSTSLWTIILTYYQNNVKT